MKKRIWAILLAVCMVFTLIPATALAEGADDTDSTPATSLPEAVDGVITLTSDVTLTSAYTVSESTTVTIDLAGYTLTNAANQHTITNNGNLTIKDSVGGGVVDNVSHQKAALVNYGTVIVDGGSFTRSAEASTGSGSSGGNSWYVIWNTGTMTINDGTFKFSDTNNGLFSSLIVNGWPTPSQNTSEKDAVMTINGGTFIGGKMTIKNDDYGTLTVTKGTFTQPTGSYYAVFSWNEAEITGGTINGTVGAQGNTRGTDGYEAGSVKISGDTTITGYIEVLANADVSVSDGTFGGIYVGADSAKPSVTGGTSTFTSNAVLVKSGVTATSFIEDGTFSDDISNYVAEGKATAINSDGKYIILSEDDAEGLPEDSEGNKYTDASAAEANSKAKIGDTYYTTLQAAINAAQSGETVQILAGTNDEAITMPLKNITLKGSENHTSVLTGGITFARGSAAGLNMKIEDVVFQSKGITLTTWGVTTYLDQVNSLVIENNEFREITGERTYAIHINNSNNAINGLTIKNNVFSGAQDGTTNGGIVATVCGTAVITGNTFTNMGMNGITLSAADTNTSTNEHEHEAETVTITNNKFDQWATHSTTNNDGRAMRLSNLSATTTLDMTGNSYICDNMLEEILKITEVDEETKVDLSYSYWNGADPEDILGTGSGKVLLERGGQAEEEVTEKTVIDPYYTAETMKPEDLNTYVPPYIPPVNSAPVYGITAPETVNGTVTVVNSGAPEGQTVIITVEADRGYELDELIVTDARGRELELTDRGDGRYSFTMPATAVEIEASFVRADGGDETRFADVAADAWYYDAVDYVDENGLMTGMTTTTFEPGTALNRGMLVTILYRLEGQPAAGTSQFSDVADSDWYADAVAWAAANGIVTGYEDGSFRPNRAVTREEMAAILYRYAAYKGYDVSERADLSGYSDGGKIQAYAVEAMQWANAEGLITGYPDNTLQPQSGANRAVAATILMRFCENIVR